jgi:hypothetical protein
VIYSTTATVFDGIDSPEVLIAFTLYLSAEGAILIYSRPRLPEIYPVGNSNQANAKFSRVIRD